MTLQETESVAEKAARIEAAWRRLLADVLRDVDAERDRETAAAGTLPALESAICRRRPRLVAAGRLA